MESIDLRQGCCLEIMKTLPDNSVDSIVTDPPYGISFMSKKWDYEVPKKEVFQEMLRVLKPGGHMLCACGTRTQHRMAVNIEDAGFEIRDVVTWLYGSGFPKSHNISKAIDKLAGAEREVTGYKVSPYTSTARNETNSMGKHKVDVNESGYEKHPITTPATPEAKQWDGFGTALKPACEFFTLARKPLSEKTVAKNVLKHGTGGINIDGCRIESPDARIDSIQKSSKSRAMDVGGSQRNVIQPEQLTYNPQGRFPANLILDEEAAMVLDEQSGVSKSTNNQRNNKPSANLAMSGKNLGHTSHGHNDKGGASRFFYVAKASKRERNEGLENLPNVKEHGHYAQDKWSRENMGNTPDIKRDPIKNNHPTVKPIKLMQYLCKLITPPNGTVLDPFMGSGSTGVAARNLNFKFIGIELDEGYFEIAKNRIYAKQAAQALISHAKQFELTNNKELEMEQ